MTAVVIRGDARALPLSDGSVDLVATSPPYWALRSYQDGGHVYDGQRSKVAGGPAPRLAVPLAGQSSLFPTGTDP